MNAASPPAAREEAIARQAAQWIVRLTDDDETERQRARAAFDAWKRADPRHAIAARDMEHLVSQMHAVRTDANGSARPARAGLDAAYTGAKAGRRRHIRHIGPAIMAALFLAGSASMVLHAWPPSYLLADLRTGTGQWETRTLTDGTRITLNSASAVNLRYDERRRAIELVQGEILVDVAKDAARPFLVETAHAGIRALGTRFVVDRQSDATVLSMIESKAAVQAAAQRATGSGEATEVSAGQRVRITASAVGPAQAIDTRALAATWKYRQLVVNDQPLGKVLGELARYRPGRIHYDPAQLEDIRVSAVLPLDDTDRALNLLQTSFPALRVRTVTPWLVLVDKLPAP